MQYLDRIYTSQDWITLLLLCCIIITTAVKIAYPLRFQEFLKLPLSNKYFFVFAIEESYVEISRLSKNTQMSITAYTGRQVHV